MTSITNGVVIFCIVATLIIVDASLTLILILNKVKIFVDQKSLLMQKTNKELRAILVGIEKNLN